MSLDVPPPDVSWFRNCGSWPREHNLATLRRGLANGWLDEQDEYGMSALSLCVSSQWLEGAEELLRAGASTLVRYHRTGETMLYMATLAKDEAFIALLLAHGADPDAPNYWGMTPRRWRPQAFEHIPRQSRSLPAPRIQNAEHLADNHFPNFKIAGRGERESLQPGQAVDLVVYGPEIEGRAIG